MNYPLRSCPRGGLTLFVCVFFLFDPLLGTYIFLFSRCGTILRGIENAMNVLGWVGGWVGSGITCGLVWGQEIRCTYSGQEARFEFSRKKKSACHACSQRQIGCVFLRQLLPLGRGPTEIAARAALFAEGYTKFGGACHDRGKSSFSSEMVSEWRGCLTQKKQKHFFVARFSICTYYIKNMGFFAR